MKYKRFVVKLGTAILGAAMITSAFSVAGVDNTVRADVTANNVLMLNSGKTLTVETPKDSELDVPKIKSKKLKDLPGVADVQQFSWKKGSSVTEFEFTVKKSGVYSVFSSDGEEGFKIVNSMGATIVSRQFAYSNSVYTAQLKAGTKYKFCFILTPGYDCEGSSYTLCPPKDVVDVTGYTSVDDSFEFIGQSIEYKYTAPKTGKYRIQFDKSIDNNVNFEVMTEDGSKVADDGLSPTKGFFANLEKGQNYIIRVTGSKVSDFTYSINVPKDTLDISKYTIIKDNLEFDQQCNRYEYTAPRSGTYNISLSDVKDTVYLKASDSKGNKIQTISTKTSTNMNIEMQKGAKYVFEAFPNELTDNTVTPYKITITPQKPIVDISSYDAVKDTFTFHRQKNEYTLKVPEDGKYSFNVTFGDAGTFAIYDAKINKVASWTNYFQNTVHKVEVELKKGSYEITFGNDSNVTYAYTIDITKPTVNNDQIKGFINRIYTYVLDRESEEEGVNFWYSELYNFNRTGAEVAQGFIFSPEFEKRNTTNEEFIEILYKTFFGRESDISGMTYWLTMLESKSMSRADVANGFIFSQEWADTCASYGIRSGCDSVAATVAIKPTDATNAFVERMYTTAMKRASDESGKKFWASELSNFRTTGENVGAAFFLSDEMNSFKLTDLEFLERLYATFMDREADEEGAAYWLVQLSQGTSRAQVVYGFTRSPEFVEKCVAARILPYLDTAVPGVG